MRGDFFDTNILFYAASSDRARSELAEGLIVSGGTISTQVLNEFADAAHRKRILDWAGVKEYLGGVRLILHVVPITEQTHDLAVAVADRHQLRLYDASIIAAALEADCHRLYSEDMHHGLVIDGRLTIINPFRG